MAVKRTNTVSFGKRFAIVLEKDQLMYYTDGQLMKCIDVAPTYSYEDLFSLATRISAKNDFGEVINTTKDKVVKKY